MIVCSMQYTVQILWKNHQLYFHHHAALSQKYSEEPASDGPKEWTSGESFHLDLSQLWY